MYGGRGRDLFWLLMSSCCLEQGTCARELQEIKCPDIIKLGPLCRLGREYSPDMEVSGGVSCWKVSNEETAEGFF